VARSPYRNIAVVYARLIDCYTSYWDSTASALSRSPYQLDNAYQSLSLNKRAKSHQLLITALDEKYSRRLHRSSSPTSPAPFDANQGQTLQVYAPSTALLGQTKQSCHGPGLQQREGVLVRYLKQNYRNALDSFAVRAEGQARTVLNKSSMGVKVFKLPSVWG
jgi:hypothetical protein